MHMVHLVLRELKWNSYKPSSMTRVYYLFTTFDGILIRLNANLCKVSSKENVDTPCRYRIYRHLPTYEKIIKFNISFQIKDTKFFSRIYITLLKLGWGINN